MLRIGEQHDLSVSIQADTDDALELMSQLFEPWIEQRPLDASVDTTPVFSVQLARDGGPSGGPRPRCWP